MKTWNTPEVIELNINETASGSYTNVTEEQVIANGDAGSLHLSQYFAPDDLS